MKDYELNARKLQWYLHYFLNHGSNSYHGTLHLQPWRTLLWNRSVTVGPGGESVSPVWVGCVATRLGQRQLCHWSPNTHVLLWHSGLRLLWATPYQVWPLLTITWPLNTSLNLSPPDTNLGNQSLEIGNLTKTSMWHNFKLKKYQLKIGRSNKDFKSKIYHENFW